MLALRLAPCDMRRIDDAQQILRGEDMALQTKFIRAAILCVLAAGVFACAKRSPKAVQTEMRDAYSAVHELYHYVWNAESFSKPENEAPIKTLLDRLSSDFHRVEKRTPTTYQEPGFEITLAANQEMLKDIRARFAAGNKDYANWRLRGLVGNCISCHTRYQGPIDFAGDTPQPVGSTFEERLAVGEFLTATRQFEKAAESLLLLAQVEGNVRGGTHNAIEALKLWLLVQVRVKDDFRPSAKDLETYLQRTSLTSDGVALVQSWRKGLLKIAKMKNSTDVLAVTRMLLKPIARAPEFYQDDVELPLTLRATSLLHTFLARQDLTVEQRREATYHLGLAYAHVNVRLLDTFRDLYLEQCVREFPNTRESRECFELFKDEVEFQSSGSGGVNLPESDATRLQELQKVAYGL